ncbi:hypothetical protein PR048_031929 [Dryococelus australis]|uniref:Uncharacterized protein n=1 Tax=Dryococelus australis TaxID=614101 RepID=A0ABQ9G6P2_9NEOP|nr:hypothetical protein PR048_031929 [Dryococelus australis]
MSVARGMFSKLVASSLALSGEGALDVRSNVVLIVPALLFLISGKKRRKLEGRGGGQERKTRASAGGAQYCDVKRREPCERLAGGESEPRLACESISHPFMKEAKQCPVVRDPASHPSKMATLARNMLQCRSPISAWYPAHLSAPGTLLASWQHTHPVGNPMQHAVGNQTHKWSEEIWVTFSNEVLRANDIESRRVCNCTRMEGRGKPEIPEKTRRPVVSSGTIPTYQGRCEWVVEKRERNTRCRWSAGFLGDPTFPLPFHYSAAPYSFHFTLIGSQYLVVKSRPNLSTHSFLRTAAVMFKNATGIFRVHRRRSADYVGIPAKYTASARGDRERCYRAAAYITSSVTWFPSLQRRAFGRAPPTLPPLHHTDIGRNFKPSQCQTSIMACADSAGLKGRGKWEIPDKTRLPTASSGTIPICENPE